MVWNKAVFCLEVVIYKHLQIWPHNYVINRNEYIISIFVRIDCSLGVFTAIFVYIYTSFMEIWKKIWVGVFFLNTVYIHVVYSSVAIAKASTDIAMRRLICAGDRQIDGQ